MIYARIDGNTVAELFTPPAGFTIADCFHSDLTWVDVTAVSPPPVAGWTATETAGVWTFAAPVAPTVTLADRAAAAINAGITLTLSGSLTLAATRFPTDPETQVSMTAVITKVLATGTFPGGAATFPLRDSTGTWHTFTILQYKAVAGQISDYVAALMLITHGNPLSAVALPSASVSLTV